jgi:hypothetical protein
MIELQEDEQMPFKHTNALMLWKVTQERILEQKKEQPEKYKG